MTTKDDMDQAGVVEFFLSQTLEGGGKCEISACMARLTATDILSSFGKFMKAETNRPNQHPVHTIAAVAGFNGMMLAYAMSLAADPKHADKLEVAVNQMSEMAKASCLSFLRASAKMEEKNG